MHYLLFYFYILFLYFNIVNEKKITSKFGIDRYDTRALTQTCM